MCSLLWKPDPIFVHQKSHGHMESLLSSQTDETFVAFRVKEKSEPELWQKQKVRAVVRCPMETGFKHFPFDSHR